MVSYVLSALMGNEQRVCTNNQPQFEAVIVSPLDRTHECYVVLSYLATDLELTQQCEVV